jgi:hypothetical protein
MPEILKNSKKSMKWYQIIWNNMHYFFVQEKIRLNDIKWYYLITYDIGMKLREETGREIEWIYDWYKIK